MGFTIRDFWQDTERDGSENLYFYMFKTWPLGGALTGEGRMRLCNLLDNLSRARVVLWDEKVDPKYWQHDSTEQRLTDKYFFAALTTIEVYALDKPLSLFRFVRDYDNSHNLELTRWFLMSYTKTCTTLYDRADLVKSIYMSNCAHPELIKKERDEMNELRKRCRSLEEKIKERDKQIAKLQSIIDKQETKKGS